MRELKNIAIFLVVVITTMSCKKPYDRDKSLNCMASIFKQDDSLGSIRNHACEKITLSKTISNYVTSMKRLDFKNCPDDFKNAFEEHEAAWKDMIQVTDNYQDLRGELHDLFDQIEASPDSLEFKKRLKLIWDTWAKIEKVSKSGA